MNNENQLFNTLKDLCNIEVSPCESAIVSDSMKKLSLTPEQKSKMSFLASQLPMLTAASAVSNLYTVKFPEGVPHTLMRLSSGGVGSAVMGEKGIVAHASFHQLNQAAMMMNAFSVMSIATGQYFLTQINNEFAMLNQKIDKIVDFLYGDKKAELISEISFMQHTYKNFASIMAHKEQRVATIAGLQAGRKVAMKDIEFYLCDLDGKSNAPAKSYSEFEVLANDAFRIRDSLDLSIQLYVMSSLMEVYYAENNDNDYIAALKDDIVYYINKCDKRILSNFSRLNGRNSAFKAGLIKKLDTSKLDKSLSKVINSMNDGEDSEIRKIINSVLESSFHTNEYCLSTSGDVYLSARC